MNKDQRKTNEAKNGNIFTRFSTITVIFGFLKKNIWLVIVLLILFIMLLLYMSFGTKKNELSIGSDNKIDITPEQVRSIEEIGQWEFLSISDEEFIDTIRKGFFSDDKLARIYVGTLRLGINMDNVEKNWIYTQDDTLRLNLPKIGLLDKNFIDEARTKAFYESGKWNAEDREALYQRAYDTMLKRCITTENIKKAEDNAREQFTNLLNSMGFNKTKITFVK
jgi:hypothetical protein